MYVLHVYMGAYISHCTTGTRAFLSYFCIEAFILKYFADFALKCMQNSFLQVQ